MSKLPFWAQIIINTALSVLVSFIPNATPEVKQAVKDSIIALINHFLGADNVAQALTKVNDAHACVGIGCAPKTKGLG